MTTAGAFWGNDLGGFPPGREFLVIPRHPRRATESALALYEGVETRQRVVLAATRLAARAGVASRLLRPLPQPPPGLDVDWWRAWFDETAAPQVAAPSTVAYRVPPNGRTSALLLDEPGAPLAFAKVLSGPPSPLHAVIVADLQQAYLPFSTPLILDEGHFRGRDYRTYAPLPEGVHRRPPASDRVHAIIRAWQSALALVPRPAGVPDTHVVVHGDFTPRNLRVAADGGWWLIDWDNARWGPRVADELHYWCADRCWRATHRQDRDAAWVLNRLRRHADDAEIAAAATWADAPARTYRAAEQQLRTAVGRLATEGRHER